MIAKGNKILFAPAGTKVKVGGITQGEFDADTKADVTYVDENDANLQNQIETIEENCGKIVESKRTFKSDYVTGTIYIWRQGQMCHVYFEEVKFLTTSISQEIPLTTENFPTPSHNCIFCLSPHGSGSMIRMGISSHSGSLVNWWASGISTSQSYQGFAHYRIKDGQ